MPRKNHDFSKVGGIRELERYLLEVREPVRQSDLADRFGCNRHTIRRWLEELEGDGVPIIRHEPDRRISLDRNAYFTHIRLSRDENVMTMIALRLMQQHMPHTNIHTIETMHKIGISLTRGLAPAAGEYLLAQTRYQRQQISGPPSDTQRFLERIAQAWLNQTKLSWRYRPLRARQSFEEVFHPYLIEPIALGGSTYIIGFSELAAAIRTRKLERIDRLPILLDEQFEMQRDFDPVQLLKGAWGIWFAPDEPPVQVVLRFHRSVKRRVLETQWHGSQTTEEDDQGYLIWRAVVDEWTPLVPWVRGWGADCEVLAPTELRNEVVASIRRSMTLYNLNPAGSQGPDDEVLRSILGG